MIENLKTIAGSIEAFGIVMQHLPEKERAKIEELQNTLEGPRKAFIKAFEETCGKTEDPDLVGAIGSLEVLKMQKEVVEFVEVTSKLSKKEVN